MAWYCVRSGVGTAPPPRVTGLPGPPARACAKRNQRPSQTPLICGPSWFNKNSLNGTLFTVSISVKRRGDEPRCGMTPGQVLLTRWFATRSGGPHARVCGGQVRGVRSVDAARSEKLIFTSPARRASRKRGAAGCTREVRTPPRTPPVPPPVKLMGPLPQPCDRKGFRTRRPSRRHADGPQGAAFDTIPLGGPCSELGRPGPPSGPSHSC
ncbi:hypothetical protein SAFG77S_06336 [Streptomyces afghaniensis]